MRTDALLCDISTHKPITDKLRLIYIQLPCFTKENWEDCANDFELWIYLLKNSENMENIPFARPGSPFEKFASRASYASMTPAEKREYDADLQVYRDYVNTIDFAAKQGEAKGFAKGEAKGFAKGEAKGFAKGEAKGFAKGEAKGFAKATDEIILACYENGIDLNIIAASTNKPLDYVKKILGLK